MLERQVAIKLMHREMSSDSDQLERFRREARAVAQLNHPHIVGVIDAGEDDRPPYIVFEYVEGETLKDRIRRLGRLPVPEAVAYAIEIARALGAAHERQIVHRDVKPQNVLIDEEGTAKVTDFGIARTMTEEGLTADGRVLGTTDYVSPEQALGQEVGPSRTSTRWAIVLFEMLTGDVPFSGENQVAVAMKHVREELPDVQMRRPEVSSALAAVIDRATAKEVDQPLQRRRRADRRPRGRPVDRDRAHGPGHRRGDERAADAAPQRAPPAAAALARQHRPAARARGAARGGDRRDPRAGAAQHASRHRARRGAEGPAQAARTSSWRATPPTTTTRTAPAASTPSSPSSRSTATRRRRGRRRTTTRASCRSRASASTSTPSRRVDAKTMLIQTPTPGLRRPGLRGQDGAARRRSPTPAGSSSAARKSLKSRQPIALDTAGQRFRYYLIWITKLPPNSKKVEISEVAPCTA